MKLRTRLNLVLTGLMAVFLAVLLADQIRDTRSSVREEIEAANRVAAQLMGTLAVRYSRSGGTAAVQDLLGQLGHVRANEITLRDAAGELLYRSPPPVYKAGREAPAWFSRLLAPEPARQVYALAGGARLAIEAQPSRAILDAWDDLTRLAAFAALLLVVVGGLAFWLVDRALAPFPVIVDGLERLQRGELSVRLPRLPGAEAHTIGSAFNRMAQAVQDKMQAEREAREARTRLEERRELARLISQEAARLYDAMHGLIPRLAPLSLDTLGLAESLESLVRDWQRRHPALLLTLRHQLPADLGASVSLAAYRVVQEGLVNAVRHAQARHVMIDVSSTAERMIVSVADDGVGLSAQWSRPGHFGLRGLAERVEHLGGGLQVRNSEPHGVTLTAEIPLAVGA